MHPGARPLSLVILLFLLVPSAAYLWNNSDLPQFGDLHDDMLRFSALNASSWPTV